MTSLQADQLSEEFLKSFMPETIYLVPGDAVVPKLPGKPIPVESIATSDKTVAKPDPVIKDGPVQPKAEKSIVAAPVKSDKYVVMGENRKGVVVLVTLPDQTFQQLPKLQLLQKMLTSIGFEPEDVAYVNNISGRYAVFEELQKLISVKYIISFASRLDTALPHDRFTLYNPVKVADVPVVFSQSLDVLEKDEDHKRQLWAVFQKVFL